MLSILPFLLLGLGLSFLVDGGDDGDDDASTSAPDLENGSRSDEDLLDYVEGLELDVQTLGRNFGTTPLTGTEGDDTITGGADDDTLNGAGGDDLIDGRAGDDEITGGAGDDSIWADDGADTVFGGAGDDVLDGTQTAPFVIDTPLTETDTTTPTQNDSDTGDRTVGDTETTEVEGPIIDPADPMIGNQLLDGGTGDDTLIGDQGDTLTGGDGADSFIVDADAEALLESVLLTDFDPTTDTLTLNVDGLDVGDPTEDGFGFDVETNDLSDGSGMEVVIQGVVVATLVGVTVADDITISVVAENTGAANPGTFSNLGDGDDTIVGAASDDTVNGGEGNDVLEGLAGRDVLHGDAGDDTLDGGAGRDDLSGGAGNDLLIGGGNDEAPVTTVVQELLDGGAGDDTLQTGDGFVALTGGEGTDVFEITRTETSSAAADAFGVRVTEITDLDVATEEVTITFVNGDASNAPVPFTLVDAPDASGVAVVIGGEVYTFLTGVLAADAPTVTVTSASA